MGRSRTATPEDPSEKAPGEAGSHQSKLKSIKNGERRTVEASRRLRNGEAFGETPGTCRKITRRALRSARNAALSERTLPKLGLERTGKSNERVSLAFSPDGVRKATSRCRLARRADDSNTTYLCPPVGRARAGRLRCWRPGSARASQPSWVLGCWRRASRLLGLRTQEWTLAPRKPV